MSGGWYVQEVVTHPPDMGPQGLGTHPALDMGSNGIRSASGRYASYWNAFLSK